MAQTATELKGKHAIVTGGGRGIGATIAAALVKAGLRVSILGRTLSQLEETARGLGAQNASAFACDIADERSIEVAFTSARDRFGPVHVLVNNAGQAESRPFTRTDPSFWNRLIAVNLTGPYLCTRQALPDMLTQKAGRIVNIASVAGLRGAPYVTAYVASKHGVVGLTRALAQEVARQGITVNCICPGFTDTQIVRDAIKNISAKTGRSEAEALATLTSKNPQGRLVQPKEIAHAVLWLVQPSAEAINGQSIAIDGGELS